MTRLLLIVILSAAAGSGAYWSWRDYQSCIEGTGPLTRGVLWDCERP